jgi:hypothetical protein
MAGIFPTESKIAEDRSLILANIGVLYFRRIVGVISQRVVFFGPFFHVGRGQFIGLSANI